MGRILPLFAAAFVAFSVPAAADADVDMRPAASSARELPPYLQCVPYAREVSGIEIFGDAHTWWDQAQGRYKRGHKPRVGAVMAFRPSGNMTLGHVAAVSKVVDKRTVLLRHANWSPIDGRRGQIENDVKAIDVSPGNDWSEVRVWYAPLQALGTTAWPVEGFIYSDRPQNQGIRTITRIAAETPRPAPVKAKAREDVVANIIAANS
jgi:surface antigen